jgi:hypothetical protein
MTQYSKGNTDIHNQKKLKKEKSHYNVPVLAAAETPPRQHIKSRFSKTEVSKKETMHKQHHRPIKNLSF